MSSPETNIENNNDETNNNRPEDRRREAGRDGFSRPATDNLNAATAAATPTDGEGVTAVDATLSDADRPEDVRGLGRRGLRRRRRGRRMRFRRADDGDSVIAEEDADDDVQSWNESVNAPGRRRTRSRRPDGGDSVAERQSDAEDARGGTWHDLRGERLATSAGCVRRRSSRCPRRSRSRRCSRRRRSRSRRSCRRRGSRSRRSSRRRRRRSRGSCAPRKCDTTPDDGS